MVKSKKSRIPPPDLKQCVRSALVYAISQIDSAVFSELFDNVSTNVTDAQVYEYARELAINYIKKGVEL